MAKLSPLAVLLTTVVALIILLIVVAAAMYWSTPRPVPGWDGKVEPGNTTYDYYNELTREKGDLQEGESAEVATCRVMGLSVHAEHLREELGLQEWPEGENLECFMVVDNVCYLYSKREICAAAGEKNFQKVGDDNFKQNTLYMSTGRQTHIAFTRWRDERKEERSRNVADAD